MVKWTLLLAGASLGLAQQYTISTVAGGAPPPTPAAATGTSIGQPRHVALDSAGNVYFSSGNSVFKISGSTMTLVAGNSRAGFSGDGGAAVNAQLNAPQGIGIDSSGNIYIADSLNDRVRKVDTNGIIRTFAGNGTISPGGPRTYGDGAEAVNARMHLPVGIAVAKNGNVYIAVSGDNNVRVVGTDGIIQTWAGDSYPSFDGDYGNAATSEINKPSDVAVDSAGNIYIADNANMRIRKVDTNGIISTIAGTGAIGTTGDNALAINAALLSPISVAVDSSNNVFILQNGDSIIRKVDAKGNITTIAGTGTPGFAGDGSSADKAQFNYPTGLAVDGSGNLYIADALNLRVRKIAGSTVSTIAGNGTVAYSGDGGAATKAQLNAPQGVAVDASGNLYIADTVNNAIRRVAAGGTISTLAGGSSFSAPQGIAVDSSGNVYVADTGNSRVQKVSASGSVTTFAGNGTPGFGGDGGAAGSSQLNLPTGVAVDGAGNVYIADYSNHRVRKVSAGGTITTVAGSGVQGYGGDNGAAVSARLNYPSAVAVDTAGNLYIADTGNDRIRRVSATGTITTIAGNGLNGFSGDGGAPTSAQIGSAVGVAVDATGNVYFTDGGSRIRKIYTTGFIFTIAGTGTTGYSGDGGVSAAAQLNAPSALAVDAAGDVFVADTGNSAVRELVAAGFGLKIGAVANGASNLAGPAAPGELVVIYGSGLGPDQLATAQLTPVGVLPTSVAGTRVLVNGIAAPILYSSASQVAAFIPFNTNTVTAQVVVQYANQVSSATTVNVAAVAPAIFAADSSGKGQVASFNQDGSVNGPSHPASAGAAVAMYITGAGQTNPQGTDGSPGAIPLPLPTFAVTATIGGKQATVQYAGGAVGIVAGVMQVNLIVPAGLSAGAQAVQLQVGGVATPAGTTISVSGN